MECYYLYTIDFLLNHAYEYIHNNKYLLENAKYHRILLSMYYLQKNQMANKFYRSRFEKSFLFQMRYLLLIVIDLFYNYP